MRIIPAIDIIDGQCVRLSQGDYDRKKIYNENPLEVAKSFEDAGIKHLHLVDLDGAKSKRIVNKNVLEQICSKTNLLVDFGGGVKSTEDVKIALNAGANQITAGSIAYKNPDLVKDWIEEFGAEKIILGADVAGGKIAINGWKETTDISGIDFIAQFSKLGVRSVISTAIETDGMLSGPATEWYKVLLEKFSNIDVIASGGVSCIDDVKVLNQIGCQGVIIGKAIYENRITLSELRDYVD
jgi:phosphoribosylformimino-5-aminoimidazole carboxamide ribotide isomerase